MAENSRIEWTHATFNPWLGCSKVSAGCTHCYAEAFAKRTGMAKWGPNGTRVKTSEAYWRQPLKWNREAEKEGVRRNVFCASLADIFEDWPGYILSSRGEAQWWRRGIGIVSLEETTRDLSSDEHPATMDDVRARLFALIDATPHLDWLLLTKRPENIRRMLAADGRHRDNVWLGTSLSTQADADRNIPLLLKCRDLSPVLFLSVEPLLGPVDLRSVHHDGLVEIDSLRGTHGVRHPHGGTGPKIDWVIVGGESGQNARPMHPDWARSIRDQCASAGVAFFFKQWGQNAPYEIWQAENGVPANRQFWLGTDGRIEHCENRPDNSFTLMASIGKKRAGRLLDGVEWNQMPTVEATQT